MMTARAILAIVNYLVCVLNFIAYTRSHESRDFWAAVAWWGSGTFWAWQALFG